MQKSHQHLSRKLNEVVTTYRSYKLLLQIASYKGQFPSGTIMPSAILKIAVPKNSDPHPKSTKMRFQNVLKCDPKKY